MARRARLNATDVEIETDYYLLGTYRDQTHILTFDNGKEFAEHERVAEALEADTYFAHPYASWERGTNENTNGLLRQCFPKDSDFAEATDARVAWVHERLNTRPKNVWTLRHPRQSLER